MRRKPRNHDTWPGIGIPGPLSGSTWWVGLYPWGLAGLSLKEPCGTALLWAHHLQDPRIPKLALGTDFFSTKKKLKCFSVNKKAEQLRKRCFLTYWRSCGVCPFCFFALFAEKFAVVEKKAAQTLSCCSDLHFSTIFCSVQTSAFILREKFLFEIVWITSFVERQQIYIFVIAYNMRLLNV